jgi:type 1 glutamine amidotransferase
MTSRTWLALILSFFAGGKAMAAGAKVVLIAGAPSHGPGDHEYAAGLLLLEKCLKQAPGVEPVMVRGWPQDEAVLEGARSVVLYMDGGDAHLAIQEKNLAALGKLMEKGVGLVCIHYAVEFPKRFEKQVQEWLGGYYETGRSRNPMNDVEVSCAARDHPVARGFKPRTMRDEFYYRINFRPEDKRVTPLLTLVPKDDPKQDFGVQTIAWATERADGGRAFGFTGGHFHKNWGIPEFRRVVLNAILWTAKVEVPAGGVACEVSEEDLARNLDDKGQKKKKG